MSLSERSAPSGGISVIVPCYNAARFLPMLLESLVAQTQPADEIIAIESHSSDTTLDILKQYSGTLPMRIEQRPRLGIYPAWNDGIALARYPLCYVACADDVVYPDAFRHLRQLRKQAPDASMFSWRVDVVDSLNSVVVPGGSPIVKVLWKDWAEAPHRRPGIADSLTALSMGSPYLSMMGVAFSTSLWRETGGFSTAYGPAGDVAWQARAGLRTDIVYSPRILAAWRVHERGATGLTPTQQRVNTSQRILEELSPSVVNRLNLSDDQGMRVIRELQVVRQQTLSVAALAASVKELRARNLRNLLDSMDAGVVALVPRALGFKLAKPKTSLLGLPAARLKRLLMELGLFTPRALHVSGVPHPTAQPAQRDHLTEMR